MRKNLKRTSARVMAILFSAMLMAGTIVSPTWAAQMEQEVQEQEVQEQIPDASLEESVASNDNDEPELGAVVGNEETAHDEFADEGEGSSVGEVTEESAEDYGQLEEAAETRGDQREGQEEGTQGENPEDYEDGIQCQSETPEDHEGEAQCQSETPADHEGEAQEQDGNSNEYEGGDDDTTQEQNQNESSGDDSQNDAEQGSTGQDQANEMDNSATQEQSIPAETTDEADEVIEITESVEGQSDSNGAMNTTLSPDQSYYLNLNVGQTEWITLTVPSGELFISALPSIPSSAISVTGSGRSWRITADRYETLQPLVVSFTVHTTKTYTIGGRTQTVPFVHNPTVRITINQGGNSGNGSDISQSSITLSSYDYYYSGSACRPSVTVKQESKALYSGTDYTVSYSNNINAGTAKVTVTGKGNYYGTASKTYTIWKADQTLNVTASSNTVSKGKTMQLSASGIGSISYSSSNLSVATVNSSGLVTGLAAGSATITVTAAGNGNYKSATKTITVTVTDNEAPAVNFSATSVSLNKGSNKTITVTAAGKLPSRFNFRSYRNNTSVISIEWTGEWRKVNGLWSHDITITGTATGSASVTVYLMNCATDRYVACKTLPITVSNPVTTITSSCVTLSETSYTYNSTVRKPAVTVKVGGKILKKDTDYIVSYRNNKNAGKATVTVTGKGNYKGTVEKTFVIKKASQYFRLHRNTFNASVKTLKRRAVNIPILPVYEIGSLSVRSSSKYVYVKNGKAYLKKGTPKGKYTIIVRASGNTNYSAKERAIKVTVK